MKPFMLFLSLAAAGVLLSPAQAGTVILPAPVTGSGPSAVPPTVRFLSSVSTGVNLESGRAGLNAGDPMLVTVRGDSPPLWVGSFVHGQGDLTFVLRATLSLTLDGMTKSASVQFGDALVDLNGPASSPQPGYQLSTVPLEFSLAIPWDTDLSQAVLEFSQDAAFTGSAEGHFTNSQMTAGSIIITFASVPEPVPAVTAGLAAGLLLARRRRPEEAT